MFDKSFERLHQCTGTETQMKCPYRPVTVHCMPLIQMLRLFQFPDLFRLPCPLRPSRFPHLFRLPRLLGLLHFLELFHPHRLL